MLARLLRTLYLFQITLGALLGGWLADRLTFQADIFCMALGDLAGALGLPLLLQVTTIAVSMGRARSAGAV